MTITKPPKIAKSPLTNEWYIATKYEENSNGLMDVKEKYPIPKQIIENITYDYLFRELMKDCEKGYELKINTKENTFTLTVKKEEK